MRLGIKLDSDYDRSEACRALFGSRDVPAYLRELGLEAVETPFGPETNDRELLAYARRCIDAGLRVSIHPYSEGTPFNPAWYEPTDNNAPQRLHARCFRLAGEIAALQAAPAVVNIHAAAAPRSADRHALVVQSVRFFVWAREWIDAHLLRVQPVAELQIRPGAGEDMQRIGDDYAELLEVVRRSGVRACWDLGHGVVNHRRCGLPLEPPTEFSAKVRHVHVHDVGDSDHEPLLHDTVPWRRWLAGLRATGFDGTVILEVPARHFLHAGGIKVLERSVAALREVTG